MLMTAVDSGVYTACGRGQDKVREDNVTFGNCRGWDGVLGVPEYFEHLIVGFVKFYNQSQAVLGEEEYPFYNLGRLLTRLLVRKSDLKLTFIENALGYIEADPIVMELPLEGGIKFMIGMVEKLWGTADGELLRQWCKMHKWPLVWAFNPSQTLFHCSPPGSFNCSYPAGGLDVGIDVANVRVLDVGVWLDVGKPNKSYDSLNATFNDNWKSISFEHVPNVYPVWEVLKSNLKELIVEPVFYEDLCQTSCFATWNQTCLCKE
jgi:hypothetical protein